MSAEEEAWTKVLPFDERKQKALLGHILSNHQFFVQASTVIMPEWFIDPINQKIWRAALVYWREWKLLPTKEELLESGDIKHEDQKNKNAINIRIGVCLNETQFYPNKEKLKVELTEWIHSSIFYQKLHDAIGLFNKAHFPKAYERIKEASKLIDTVSFENDTSVSFEEWEKDFSDMDNEVTEALTFGCPTVDKLLAPEGYAPDKLRGGLFRKDTTVLLAPTNVGKTTCMISTIRANLLAGKSVLFITHEGRPADIKQKIWMSLMEATKGELNMALGSSEGRARFAAMTEVLKERLVYVPHNKPGMTVEDVEIIIRKKNDERIAKYGKGFDLVVDDYPAKLTSVRAGGGKMPKRTVDEVVYDYFVQLALELDHHSLLAIQTNRTGSKVNKRQEGSNRLIDLEDVSESWPVMTMATNVISLNRDIDCIRSNKLILYIIKSRSSETGLAVLTQTDYARALTHSSKLATTWYRGGSNPADKLDDLLKQYGGGQIPDNIVD
jgi:KaiC/GvpD/RAD55 family RecA-like ATPase